MALDQLNRQARLSYTTSANDHQLVLAEKLDGEMRSVSGCSIRKKAISGQTHFGSHQCVMET
jgi:hypothetical protein